MSRTHERFKPKPRPERAVILTKKSVAQSQLETAIWLWFRRPDPISTLVLAFNAHEILHALGKKIGKPSKYYQWLEALPKRFHPERFQARWRYVWNFCKHGSKDVDDDVLHDPRHAEALINFSSQCFRDVIGKPTPLLFAFDLRFLAENPTFVDWSAVPIEKLFEVHKWSQGLTREEFLDDCLTLIRAGRLTPV
jgi:hypothetical protein